MAFNIGNYVKSSAKSSADRLIQQVVSDITTGLPGGTSLIASSTAQSLFNIGASYESIQAFSAARTDNIISGAADEFFALAGRAVNRTAGADLSQLRRAGNESLSNYLTNVNPTTKISSKRSRDELEIVAVI